MLRFSCKNLITCEDVRTLLSIELQEEGLWHLEDQAVFRGYGTGFETHIAAQLYTVVDNGVRYLADTPIHESHIHSLYGSLGNVLRKIKDRYSCIDVSGWISLMPCDDHKALCYHSPSGSKEVEETPAFIKQLSNGKRAYPIRKSWFSYSYDTFWGEEWICIESPKTAVEVIEKTDLSALGDLFDRWEKESRSSEYDIPISNEYKEVCDRFFHDSWPVY